jgi:hypothetical protein
MNSIVVDVCWMIIEKKNQLEKTKQRKHCHNLVGVPFSLFIMLFLFVFARCWPYEYNVLVQEARAAPILCIRMSYESIFDWKNVCLVSRKYLRVTEKIPRRERGESGKVHVQVDCDVVDL